MGSETYTSREKLKDMAAATGNTKYYELVAMPLTDDCYVHETKDGILHVSFYWEHDPEFIEVDGARQRATKRTKGLYGSY